MKLYLLRHGEADANVKRLVTGTPEDSLTALGREQARGAGKLLARLEHNFAGAFVSHWRRAQETAAYSCPELSFIEDKRLGETWAGAVASIPRTQFDADFPSFFQDFDPERAFPEGESHAQLYARCVEWIRECSAHFGPEDAVLCATHMGPISCFLHYAFAIPMLEFPRFRPANASVTVLNVPQNHGVPITLELYNACILSSVSSEC